MTDDGGDQFFLSPQACWAVFPVSHFVPLVCHLLHTLTAALNQNSQNISHMLSTCSYEPCFCPALSAMLYWGCCTLNFKCVGNHGPSWQKMAFRTTPGLIPVCHMLSHPVLVHKLTFGTTSQHVKPWVSLITSSQWSLVRFGHKTYLIWTRKWLARLGFKQFPLNLDPNPSWH